MKAGSLSAVLLALLAMPSCSPAPESAPPPQTAATSAYSAPSRLRYPGFPGGDRVERHLFPAVTTGPLDPAWSPDGRWIAFSMRGDIWKVPADGGEAVALTAAPGYHFEPAWGPDGTSLALTVDIDGNLDIGIVSADGGGVERITDHSSVDIEPTWSPDGRSILFVSGREGTLDIFRYDLDTQALAPVVEGPGNQIQPSVSPDGRQLAYVAPVEGLLGSGGIWVQPLGGGEPRLVHYEETSYRTRPAWTPDGNAFVYISDAAGSNDIASVPVEGGNRVRLTEKPSDEFSAAVSPDGSKIAFVANAEGPTRLFTIPTGGGAGGRFWQEVRIASRQARLPTGRLRGEVLGPDGRPIPGRVLLVASDGRSYSPDGGFHRVSSMGEVHYFHTRGQFEVEVPAGPVRVEAMRGFEYVPASADADVPAGSSVTVRLRPQRLLDAPARGWYSGDNHVHDLHEGRYGLTQEEFFYQGVADDVHVTHALIHMDGTKLMGRWSDLTGEPYELSNRDYILYYTQEFRGSAGHVGLLGLRHFVLPLIGGTSATPYAADALKVRYLDAAREHGGIGGFLHPFNRMVETPQAVSSDIPLLVALGKGDFYDVVCFASDERASADFYYRLINAGFRLAATGGTDNFSDVWRDPSGGTARTYAHLEAPLSHEAWIAAVRAGRTFATSGPLLFLEVDGRGPGEEIRLRDDDPAELRVRVEMVSLVPVDRLDIIVNGQVVSTVEPAGDGTRAEVDTTVSVPASGWVAARVEGSPHRWVGDPYPFAQTSPVYVVRDGVGHVSVEDAEFLLRAVEEHWRRVEARAAWASEEEERAYRQAAEQALATYRRIIDEAASRDAAGQ